MSDMSWLEEALRMNIAVPQVRSEETFEDLARSFVDARFVEAHPRARKVAKIIESLGASRRLWPSDVRFGETYQRLVERTLSLSANLPPFLDGFQVGELGENLLQFWADRHVKIWRSEWIERALVLGREHGQLGLRFGDVVAIAQEDLTESGRSESVSLGSLFKAVARRAPELEAKLSLFLKILAELHGQNFAKNTNLRCSVVDLDRRVASLTLGAGEVVPVMDYEEPIEIATIELPSLEDLRASKARDLTYLREGEAGSKYFASLEDWLENSGDDLLLEKLAEGLHVYGEFISSTIDQTTERKVRSLVMGRGKGMLLDATQAILSAFVGGLQGAAVQMGMIALRGRPSRYRRRTLKVQRAVVREAPTISEAVYEPAGS